MLAVVLVVVPRRDVNGDMMRWRAGEETEGGASAIDAFVLARGDVAAGAFLDAPHARNLSNASFARLLLFSRPIPSGATFAQS